MPTRAAVKREAALLQGAIQASEALVSPLFAPAETETATRLVTQLEPVLVATSSDESPKDLALSTSGKRKRGITNIGKTRESIKIELDTLPHGLGKKGDLLGDTSVKGQNPSKTAVEQASKRTGRGRAVLHDDTPSTEEGKIFVKLEKQPDSDVTELPQELLPKKRRGRPSAVKSEPEITVEEDGTIDGPSKKRRALSESEVVMVDGLENEPGQAPKKKTKANNYGLTPGATPFPNHSKPTSEDCEEVNRLLSTLHGEVKPPEVIPPPSMEVTGCGEVPDLLDAILRTLLSASTTANNANLSLQGLKEKFHLRESGVGIGSVNWEAVHNATRDEVIDAIKSGGLAKVKGTNIKKILDVVYTQNCVRLAALLEEKENGKTAYIPGAQNMTKEQKDVEIARVKENMLSMDHVFEMTTDEAMEEITKLPGIGVKTASCVILFCMKRPSFAVDTHVWRHCKWLGWVPETATRDQTFSHCEVRVPNHLKYSLHQLFLKHGKTCGRCRANTSTGTEEWDSTDCPIDHLVNRTGKKKLQVNSSVANVKPKKTTKKRKVDDRESDKSDKGVNEEEGDSGSEYRG